MQSVDNFYKSKCPQYDSGLYKRYNNLPFSYKYVGNNLKPYDRNNSYEDEKVNSNDLYNLTEKNILSKNQNNLNRIYTENNISSHSITNIHNKNHNYYKAPTNSKQFGKEQKNFSKQKKEQFLNNTYFSLNKNVELPNEINNICNNLFNKNTKEMKNKNNFLKKKNSTLAIHSFYQNNNLNDESSIYYLKNNININIDYNQNLLKNNSYSALNNNYHRNSDNNISNDYKSLIESKEKRPFELADNTFELNSKVYKDGKYVTNSNEENKEYFKNYNIDSGKIQNNNNCISTKNKTINILYNNAANLTKIAKNNNKSISSNKKEYQTYMPPVNKSPNYSKFDKFEVGNNRLIKKNIQNKNGINKVINFIEYKRKNDNNPSNKNGNLIIIKNTSQTNITPNSKELIDKKDNHSFYEIKSITKNFSTKIINPKYNNLNNIVTKDSQYNKKENNQKMIKLSNTKMLESKYIKDNLSPKMKVINLSKLNIRKEGENNGFQNEISKSTFDNTNKSELTNNELASIKENINTNNTNNIYIVQQNMHNTKSKKIILNLDITNNKKFQNIKKKYSINKNKLMNNYNKLYYNNSNNVYIINSNNEIVNSNENKQNNNNTYIIEQNQKTGNTQKWSGPSPCIERKKPVQENIINYSYFSYLAPTKNNKICNNKCTKKSKKKFNNHKNLIRLKNINNKTYEEDFKLKDYNNNLNTILKPQISVRIVIFGNKEPDNEKYYLVNMFCSENIRNQPEEIESEF